MKLPAPPRGAPSLGFLPSQNCSSSTQQEQQNLNQLSPAETEKGHGHNQAQRSQAYCLQANFVLQMSLCGPKSDLKYEMFT